jgi:hypothetical protein
MDNLPEELVFKIAEYLEYPSYYGKDSEDIIALHLASKSLFNIYKFNCRKILELLGAKYEKTTLQHHYDGSGNYSRIGEYNEEMTAVRSLRTVCDKFNIKLPNMPTSDNIIFMPMNIKKDDIPYFTIVSTMGLKFQIFDYNGDEIHYYPSGGCTRHYYYHVISINDNKLFVTMDNKCHKSPYICSLKDIGKLPLFPEIKWQIMGNYK